MAGFAQLSQRRCIATRVLIGVRICTCLPWWGGKELLVSKIAEEVFDEWWEPDDGDEVVESTDIDGYE